MKRLLKNKPLMKTIKFRFITLITTLGITWGLTGNPTTSIGITVIQQTTNAGLYYLYEKHEAKGALK